MFAAPIRDKHLDRWLGAYARHVLERMLTPRPRGARHVLFALCDHYEPLWGGATVEQGRERVRSWAAGYPRLANGFRDADGHRPRHTFFFPGEQYQPEYLELLAQLACAGLGEVELHLHHDADTPANLRHDILEYLSDYSRHGHLSRDVSGRSRYGFIHGNWSLANSRTDGRYCGVDTELEVLFETGCYADFTFPSAPDSTQPGIVNQIYWPAGDLARRGAHEVGIRAQVGAAMDDRILLVQGPLALSRKSDSFGIRIESAALTSNDPPDARRIKSWVAQGIHVVGRADWVFVKVHTHGAPEAQAAALLGTGGHALHQELTSRYNDGERFVLHYVTAREMYNIALAGMNGRTGNPAEYRDYALPPPPVSS